MTTTYTWDSRNRLTGISKTGLTASFAYDGLGRRKSKTVNGSTTGFWYDGNDVYAELSGTTPSFTYIRGLNIDEPYIRKGTSDEFYETDALGSSVALTNGAGTSQTTYTYEPFGTTTQAGTASTNPFQFTGRENDGTGLFYYRARYYSPKVQRFMSEDFLELAAGDTNFYAYVFNSPLNYMDPSGLESMDEFVADLPNLPQDLVDTIVGMGDAFLLPEVVRDLQGLQGFVNQCSTAYRAGKILGFIEGGLPLALRGAAALATTQTRIGHWLNHGRYWRIGPGRMKAAGRGLPAGTHVPRLALGPDRPGVQHPHRDLRTRIPYVIPLGGTKCGCE